MTDANGLNWREWAPPGPISAAFVASDAPIKALIGPYGSGKTTTCLHAAILNARRMPMCKDGVRRYKALAVRDTYPQLYSNLVSTWQQWFRAKDGSWTGSSNRPVKHELTFEDEYGLVEFTLDMVAIGDANAKDILDGYEPTDIFLNAAGSLSEEVLIYAIGRKGRFPARRLLMDGYSTPSQILIDANKTDVDHWVYKRCVETREIELFDLPGGMDPGAENADKLPDTYYSDMVKFNASQPWWIDINVHNKWGYSREGRPVFGHLFNERLHVSPAPLKALPGLPLELGLDAGTATGGQPAAVIGQRTPSGQARVLAIYAPGVAGPKRFANGLVELLTAKFPGARLGAVWCDPAAFGGVDAEGGEVGWVEAVQDILGAVIRAAPTNELHLRLQSVEDQLTRLIDGHAAALLISCDCGHLIKGMASHYRFKKKHGTEGVFSAQPDKNEYSHVADALQYWLSASVGRAALIRGRPGADLRRGPAAPRRGDFDVFST
jgi:hypothetical protein